MDGYLLKPIDEPQMWSVIRSIFTHHEQADPFQEFPIENDEQIDLNQLLVIDNKKLLDITGGDINLASEMFSQLCSELPQQLEEIDKYIRDENWEDLKEIAHKMRGSTSSCGVPALDYSVQRLEKASKSMQTEQLLKEYIAVENEVKRLLQAREANNAV